jgi:hypothetical protein
MFGAMDVTKSYESTWFGDIHGPKPYKFTGFGDIHNTLECLLLLLPLGSSRRFSDAAMKVRLRPDKTHARRRAGPGFTPKTHGEASVLAVHWRG